MGGPEPLLFCQFWLGGAWEGPVGGDVVVRMGGEPIRSQQVLSTYLALSTSPGDTIPVEVIRDGSRTTVQLTLGSRPDP